MLDKNGQPVKGRNGEIELQDTMTNNLPQAHDVMQEMRRTTDQFGTDVFPGTRVLIGETYVPTIQDLETEYGPPDKPEFQLPMDTQILEINKMNVAEFRARLDDAELHLDGHVPLLVFDNHDNPRLDVRYGDGVHNTEIERVIATVLFASRGASLFYYGDAIGMKTTPPARKEDVQDPVGKAMWPFYKGRDGERTPMQWNDTANAGFTASDHPWLPVPPTYKTVNVTAEEKEPDSMLGWYKSIIELKRTNDAFAHGDNVMLDSANDKVLSWIRQAPDGSQVVVTCNFTADPQTVNLSGGNAEGQARQDAAEVAGRNGSGESGRNRAAAVRGLRRGSAVRKFTVLSYSSVHSSGRRQKILPDFCLAVWGIRELASPLSLTVENCELRTVNYELQLRRSAQNAVGLAPVAVAALTLVVVAEVAEQVLAAAGTPLGILLHLHEALPAHLLLLLLAMRSFIDNLRQRAFAGYLHLPGFQQMGGAAVFELLQ